MSENDIYENYDQSFTQVRMNIAKDNNDWYKYFKIRDTYIKLMILSFFAVWLILGSIAIILQLNSFFLFLIPNLTWIFICFPYFVYKLVSISNIINIKKEEAVVYIWKTKTQNIKEIMLLTGLEKIFIDYYLEKNGLVKKSSESFEDTKNTIEEL